MIMGDGGAGTCASTLHYIVLSDVTQWTRDRALRRYIDCAAAHVGLCNTIGPAPCPAARHRTAEHRRAATACTRQASGEVPKRQGPTAHRIKRAPRIARRQSGGEAQPGGCAIRVRRPPPPELRIQRPPAGRNIWFRSRAEAGSRAARGGRERARETAAQELHCAAPQPAPSTRPRRRSAPGLGLNCWGDLRPVSPRPD